MVVRGAAAELLDELCDEVGVASLEEYSAALRAVYAESYEAANAWLQLLWLCSRPVFRIGQKLAVVLVPVSRDLAVAAAARLAAQPRGFLQAEIAVLVGLLFMWRLRAWLRPNARLARARRVLSRRYAQLVAGIRRQSLLAARLVPHVVYAGGCLVCWRWVSRLQLDEKLLPPMQQLAGLLGTALPALRSAAALHVADEARERHWIHFWTLWAFAALLSTVVASVPLVPRFLQLRPELFIAPFCAALWAQLPHSGVEMAYNTLAPFVRARAQAFAAALPTLPQPLVTSFSLALKLLMPPSLLEALTEAVQEGSVLLGAAIFLVTPGPLSRAGLLFFSLAYPMRCNVDALDSPAEQVVPRTETMLRYWLLYCIMRGALWALPLLAWIPFSTHIQLLFVVWAQLPYFRSATRLLYAMTPLARSSSKALLTLNAAVVNGSPAGVRQRRPNAHYSSKLEHDLDEHGPSPSKEDLSDDSSTHRRMSPGRRSRPRRRANVQAPDHS